MHEQGSPRSVVFVCCEGEVIFPSSYSGINVKDFIVLALADGIFSVEPYFRAGQTVFSYVPVGPPQGGAILYLTRAPPLPV